MKLDVCGGCNAKIGAGDLTGILKSLQIHKRNDVVVGFDGNEDAAIIKVTDDIGVVTSVDFFPPMVEDPYLFGKIAAANALSDLYAMGAEPISAMNLVCFPEGEELGILEEILRGGAEVCKEAECTLTGGHSIHDAKIKYGLSVLGSVNLNRFYRNNTPESGDVLILTKPLGVSLLMSGYSIGEVKQEDYEKAVASMVRLNKESFDVLKNYEVHALTDVTGFSLLGHLSEMMEEYSAVLNSKDIKFLSGAKKAAEDFLFTAGGQRNRRAYSKNVNFEVNDFAMEEVLFDPQTSGGLLISVSSKDADELFDKLIENRIDASKIGNVVEKRDYKIYVR